MAAESLAKAGEITLVGSAQGCDLEGNATAASASRIAAAVALAKNADVPIVFVGLTPNNDPKNSGTPPVVGVASALESEGHDRTDIDLQGQQEPLIKALVAANPKTVVVLCARALCICLRRLHPLALRRLSARRIHGGALDITWSKENANAILVSSHQSQSPRLDSRRCHGRTLTTQGRWEATRSCTRC